jgi:ABC-2 type transport system ATP-binding protein
MIAVKDLVKTYWTKRAVDGVSFTVRRGDILGFLGPNGAGKSTTMKIITGFLRPDAGTVSVDGIDVAADPVAVKRRLGYLPENAPSYPEMTVEEFLGFIAEVRGFRTGPLRRAQVQRAIGLTHLEPMRRQTLETLSKGYKKRVGFAQAMLHDPPALVLDEPTDGLDPNQKHAVRKLIRGMAAEKAIIVSTHLLEEVEAICTRAVIIDRGQIVADGTPGELLARSRFHNAVTLVLPSSQADAAVTRLRTLPTVASVEVARDGDVATLTAFPRKDALPVEDVSVLAVREKWDVKELYAEAGRLDEVFRAITTHDARRAGAA